MITGMLTIIGFFSKIAKYFYSLITHFFKEKTKTVYMIWFSDLDGRDLQYGVYSSEEIGFQMFNFLKTLPEYNWYLRLEKVEVIDKGEDGLEEVDAEVLDSFYHPEYVD